MGKKVYWIGLEASLNLSRRYIQRNQLNLQKSLTAPQYACLLDVLNAILSCLAILPVNNPDV